MYLGEPSHSLNTDVDAKLINVLGVFISMLWPDFPSQQAVHTGLLQNA